MMKTVMKSVMESELAWTYKNITPHTIFTVWKIVMMEFQFMD